MNKNPLALVLSGGSVRAAAHIGVLRALEEYMLRPDVIIGTSGGAIVASLYAAGMSSKELADLFCSFCDKKDAILDGNYEALMEAVLRRDMGKFSGLIKGDALEKLIHQNLKKAKTFQGLTRAKGKNEGVIPLMTLAVNLNDGKQTVFLDSRELAPEKKTSGFRLMDSVPIARAVRASSSIPLIFVPAQLEDPYVDGGVRNGYPLSVAVKLAKAKEIIGVNLGYAGMRREDIKEGGAMEILNQALDIMMMGQYKDALSHKDFQGTKILTLNPLIYDVGTFELEYIPAMIERGYEVAKGCFSSYGLIPLEQNRTKLFSRMSSIVDYPEKRSLAYGDLLKNPIKNKVEKKPSPSWLNKQARKMLHEFRVAKVLLFTTFFLALSSLFAFFFHQTSLELAGALLFLLGLLGIFLYRRSLG